MKPAAQVRSAAQEKRVAAANGGTVQRGSGSGWVHQADVDTERYLIEAKCRVDPDAKSITIKLVDLEKIYERALVVGKLPVLTFELGGRDYYLCPDVTWHDAH